MSIMTGSELGQALCKLFGLDDRDVFKITIEAEAGAAAKVIVEYAVPIAEKDQIVGTVTTFHDMKKIKMVDQKVD